MFGKLQFLEHMLRIIVTVSLDLQCIGMTALLNICNVSYLAPASFESVQWLQSMVQI
jgi:hypothetical protein